MTNLSLGSAGIINMAIGNANRATNSVVKPCNWLSVSYHLKWANTGNNGD